ncbi:alpha-amylase [Treponema ruminis]|uniref:Glycosidase n=1 Tax=Treponema ruminis TaxID=744515 RepID=A0A7W8G9J0_9SPIR|nr:alpha-amylase family glycosyl hydrolase [Treponema ruminis]MBB5226357.1 glycosidase [Treponema ruminis]QSI02738.1 alpha-amylase [Treponema ruminis]
MKKSLLYKSYAAGLFSALALSFLSCGSTSVAKGVEPLSRRANGARQGVYYSLFVRSFADSNGDGIGDFNGITAKLDYLNDGDDSTTNDLGITGIWLLPIYPTQTYHGYDVDDYYGVNPEYGTMEDFERLIQECKKRGISVILDMTCNHSSTFTDWFTASRDPSDPHHDWYRWITAEDKKYNINQQMWGHKVWNEDRKFKGNYYAGLFGPHMPDYNLDSPALREEFKKVMKFWLDKGVAGFRYDAAGHIYNSAKTPAGTNSTEQAIAWWKEITDYNKSINPDTYNVGEVWENNTIRSQYLAGLGSDFHFDMGTRIIDTIRYGDDGNNTFANGMQADYKRMAQSNPDYLDAPFLSNHDQPRAAGLLKGDVEMCKAAASLYMFTEGIPFVYYGEEIGMRSGTDDPSKRTPMLWKGTNSDGKPKDRLQTSWSESRYNVKTIPVSEQEKDPESLLQHYKKIIRVKTAHPALYEGKFTAVGTGSDKVSSWQMKSAEETAFVMVNVSGEDVNVEIPKDYQGFKAAFESYAEGTVITGNEASISAITIPAYSTVILSSGEF